jgi:hypothetical protein
MDLEHERRVAEAVLMRPRPGRPAVFRAIVLLPIVTLVFVSQAAAQRFYPDDPLEREPVPLPTVDLAVRNLSFLLEAVSGTFKRPGERNPAPGVITAQGVNTLGNVPDGPWYVNRHGRTRMSLEELRRSSGDALPPSTAGSWRVMLIQNRGGRPTLIFRDSSNRMYVLRFDPAGAPELATGAEMIASRVFHALGYHVPDVYLVGFERDRLVIESNAGSITSIGGVRQVQPADIDRLLEPVARQRDGRYRAVALRVPTTGESLIGPFQFFGTRSDDPNDIVPHEHRRDLRGLYVFSAWLNHSRIDPIHTMDVVEVPEGQPPRVRHFLFDFMATLGSGLTAAKPVWEGRDPVYGRGTALRNIAGAGIYTPAWIRAKYPDLPAVGRFECEHFEPEAWTPNYDVASFANRLPDDTFWAARQVMAFSDEEIRAIVRVAQYSDARAEAWIADCLIERRNRIGRTYFDKVLPLDGFAVRGNELVFTDLAVQHQFAKPRRYRVEWWTYDNAAGKPSARIGSEGPQVPPEASSSPIGSYLLARLIAEGVDPRMSVAVYLRHEAAGLRVVGIDRDWPGRTLVDARVVVRQVRNRYAELEPERQKLFAGYTQTLNAKTGQNQSPDDRFRAMSPSEQTTFDAITHALMRVSLTSADGRALGRALDLVTGVARIAGQQAGRSGDQQFRLYVTLRPDARDTLRQSREFVRAHQNTVYHAGYPYSYRTADGVPSMQFSLAEDGLSADIDVDYRTSKAPQSLFNGHLTATNSDVRAGDNAQRHDRRWNGFVDWWSNVFGGVKFADGAEAPGGPFGTAPARADAPLPPDRPANASIPEVADAVQEFLTDWLIRRNYTDAQAFLAADVFPCIADSLDLDPKTPPDRLRRASLRLLERAAKEWGRPRDLAEAMNPVFPWNPNVRVTTHAFDRDFTIVEAPTELGTQYECGGTPPDDFKPSSAPQYGTYYGALLQAVTEGRPGGTIVLLVRRVNDRWRLVAYRAID